MPSAAPAEIHADIVRVCVRSDRVSELSACNAQPLDTSPHTHGTYADGPGVGPQVYTPLKLAAPQSRSRVMCRSSHPPPKRVLAWDYR